MFEVLTEALKVYYGLDWASSIFGIIGILYITKKNRIGFLFSLVAMSLGATVAIMAHQFGFLIAHAVSVVLLVRGFRAWGADEREGKGPMVGSA